MRLDPFERVNLGITTGALAVSLVAASPQFAASLGLGAAFGALNLHGLLGVARRMFAGELQGSGAAVGFLGVRLALLAAAIGISLRVGAQPVALVMGLSLVVPATLIAAWRLRPPIDPAAPALSADDPAWERWDPQLARERPPGEEDDA